jgi:hypothetical protein
MSTVTAPTSTVSISTASANAVSNSAVSTNTAKHRHSRLTATLPRATVSAGVLAAAATTAGAAVLRAAGVPLAAHGEIQLAAFAQLTLIAAICGGVLLAVLVRRSAAPRRRFVQITAGLTALSCAAPLAAADTAASRAGLVVLHLLAAAIVVPVLARRAD